MKALLRWATRNSPAMNTLMIAGILLGIFSLLNLRREIFPEFDLEIVLVTVPYPGATAAEVEEGICLKIEEAVRAIDGIKKRTAVAKEGMGFMVLELETEVNAQKALNEIRSEVDRIPSFPEKAEKPEVKQVTLRSPAIRIGIIGPENPVREGDAAAELSQAELRLRQVTENVRDKLIRLMPGDLEKEQSFIGKILSKFQTQKEFQPIISTAEINGAKPFQIDVEISEQMLRRYNLTLPKAADILRKENLELPGGTIKTDAQEILVKGKTKAVTGEEIRKLPLVTQPDGVVLTVGDLATVHDEFADMTSITRINGKPGMVITVSRTAREDLLAVTDAVHTFVKNEPMPPGYELIVWDDRSIDVKDRMNMLATNGLQGLVLVLIALALFLESRLAFWVAMGIPLSILGTCALLWMMGETLNMLSMFAFLMALGIVVDDAIVVGENIYAHRQRGVSYVRAAIDGAWEVFPSVLTSVTTTMVAFMPLLFVTGIMGKFIAVLPIAMICMLAISLLESFSILPCHLSHRSRLTDWILKYLLYPVWLTERVFNWLSTKNNKLLALVAEFIYVPILRFAMKYPAIILCSAVAVLLVAVGLVRGGAVPFIVFPKMDSKSIEAVVRFPDGTPTAATDEATRRLELAIKNVNAKYENEIGEQVVNLTHRSVGYVTTQSAPGKEEGGSGSHIGGVAVELVDTGERSVNSDTILTDWRKEWQRLNPGGEFPGVESIVFQSAMMGPRGKPIEFRLLGPAEKFAELEELVKKTKKKLEEYKGVESIDDDSQPGKTEYVYRIKDKALAMGITQGDLIQTIHAAFYGEEVMRLQRGRHEVKFMVRYPKEERKSLANLDQIRLRGNDGAERPVTELAEIDISRSYTEFNRVDQLRSITITAEVDEREANANQIVADLRANFIPDLQAQNPWLQVRWEGQQQQTVESMQSLFVGFLIALIGMYVLLTLEFRSYIQPIFILLIIPFGAVGAIMGHYLLGLSMTMFSVFGLVALTGVVINDSIVLIDFINKRVRAGVPLQEALLESGQRRLRPVMLTSMTTIAGLTPLMLERSFQAQFLIPMAVSLCFGLLVSTTLVLFLLPTLYSIYGRIFPPQIDSDEEHEGEPGEAVERLAPPPYSSDPNGETELIISAVSRNGHAEHSSESHHIYATPFHGKANSP